MVYGFTLTDKYLIAAAQRCVVYSHDPLRPGKKADLDIGLNWEVKCHPESSLLLVATWDAAGKVGLWDFENGTHIQDFIGGGMAHHVAFLNKSQYASSSTYGGEIFLWQREKQEPTHTLQGHRGRINRLESKESMLFSASEDGTVRIWNTTSGECIQVLEGHPEDTSILTFSPDGSLLRVGDGHGQVRIWDWKNGKMKAERQTEARHTTLYVNTNNGNLLTGGIDGTIKTWTQDGELVHSFIAHEVPVRGLARVGQFLVTIGTSDGRIKLWDWQSRKWLVDLQGSIGFIRNYAAGHGKLAILSDGEPRGARNVQVWDLDLIEQFASRHVDSAL
ncbi:unnamed protein product [Clonostachys chloroleuca]|uniref:Mitochondrial division protein 1 n=1 Tax=Clonostachys chloroleuca TaxID=1926264 RepID=A0AA35Q779_9HYPO|nr:unnamed protein product [Clonostachys chloroleuca]